MIEKTTILGDDNPILFLGNGVARAFEGDSWEKIIRSAIEKFGCRYSYDQIIGLPATFQITAATNNSVSDAMEELSKKICEQEVGNEYCDFIKDYILALPITDIISTNYSYEMEKAIIPGYSTSYNNRSRRKTKAASERENQMMLYRYNNLESAFGVKRIWHVHGEACTPSTMIMSQYYYGYKISSITNYIKDNMGYFKTCEKNGEYPIVKSWIDLFLMRDVYLVGFGMDLSESDFWWLVSYKKLYFPATKIYSFEPNLFDGNPKRIMAKIYGIDLQYDSTKVGNVEFKQFYKTAFEKMANGTMNK